MYIYKNEMYKNPQKTQYTKNEMYKKTQKKHKLIFSPDAFFDSVPMALVW